MVARGENYNILEILYSLKDIIRVSILELLFCNDEEGASFKDIVSKVQIGPTIAAYHLKILLDLGLVEKKFCNKHGRRDYSFYHLTRFGERAYIFAKRIQNEIREIEKNEEINEVPDILITHMRYGPRCISIERSLE